MSASDLDSLLDSALDDFDRPADIPVAAAQTISPPASVASIPAVSPPVSSPTPDFSGFLASMQDSAEGKELLSILGPEKLKELTAALGEMALQEMKPENQTAENSTESPENDMEVLMKLAKSLESAAFSGPAPPLEFVEKKSANPQTTISPTAANNNNTTSSASNSIVSPSSSTSSSAIEDAISMVQAGVKANPLIGGDSEFAGMEDMLTKFLSEFEGKLGENSNEKNNNSSAAAGQSSSASSIGDSAMDSLIEKLMGEMMSKEYLYEPMKEITKKYPNWLSNNKLKLNESEYNNYQSQYQCFVRVCGLFENSTDNNKNTKEIMEIMTEIQNYGKPPEEIIGSFALPGGAFDFGAGGAANDAPPTAAEEEELKKLADKGCPTM